MLFRRRMFLGSNKRKCGSAVRWWDDEIKAEEGVVQEDT